MDDIFSAVPQPKLVSSASTSSGFGESDDMPPLARLTLSTLCRALQLAGQHRQPAVQQQVSAASQDSVGSAGFSQGTIQIKRSEYFTTIRGERLCFCQFENHKCGLYHFVTPNGEASTPIIFSVCGGFDFNEFKKSFTSPQYQNCIDTMAFLQSRRRIEVDEEYGAMAMPKDLLSFNSALDRHETHSQRSVQGRF